MTEPTDDTRSASATDPDEDRDNIGADDDYLVRGMALDGSVRALAVRSTHTCNALMQRHGSLPTAASAVCRVATGCLLLGGTIKGRAQVGIEVKGDGPLGSLYGVADAHGKVRVTVQHPLVDLAPRADGKFDVPSAVGMGQLVVTKNLGMKEPYSGVVPLVSGGIARDLVEYFHSSEQKPAAMALGEIVDVNGVNAAGGYLLQVFPDPDEDAAAARERQLEELEQQVGELRPVSELIDRGTAPEEILNALLPDFHVLERYPVHFECACSAERFERILVTLGTTELRSMIEEDGGAELRCHFCNAIYTYTAEELEHVLTRAKSGIN